MIKLQLQLQLQVQKMTNGPIRVKQVNHSSSVIGRQDTGQASTRECTVVADRFYQYKCTLNLYSAVTGESKVRGLLRQNTGVHRLDNNVIVQL